MAPSGPAPMESLFTGVPILGFDELRAQSLDGLLPRHHSNPSIYGTDELTVELSIIEEDCAASRTSSPKDPGYFSPLRVPCNSEAASPVQRSPSCDETFILQRHLAGLFDWILTVPHDLNPRHQGQTSGSRILRYYGCNVVKRLHNPGNIICCENRRNLYKVFATELRPDAPGGHSARLDHKSGGMALPEPIVRLTSPPVAGKAEGDVVDLHVPQGLYETGHKVGETTASPEWLPSTSPSTASSQGRIEDSVEALDKLEDDLEALHVASHVRKLPLPEGRQASAANNSGFAASTAGGKLNSKSASVRIKPTAARPTLPLLRRSASMNLRDDTKVVSAPHTQGGPPARRKPVVTRPSSLDPPSGPVKSTKPPTRPTFELSGENVARRIKEQREARRAAQAAATVTATSVAPQRTKSLRAQAVPKFELPGEAFSRKKREQHEKQLQEQAMEERRRREFKAAPVRSSVAPTSYPRETAASRARRVKASGKENQEPVRHSVAPAQAAPVRASAVGLASRPSLRKSASTISSASTASTSSRGRVTRADESQTSRDTSTSVGSANIQRRPISHEDAERQRLRGKEIYDQDNSYAASKEQERRQREMAAKAARDQANERSRQFARQQQELKLRRQSAVMDGVASSL